MPTARLVWIPSHLGSECVLEVGQVEADSSEGVQIQLADLGVELRQRRLINAPTASSLALNPVSPLWLTQTRMAKSRCGAIQTLAKFIVLSPP